MTGPTKTALTIAGLDPSGGAGIVADLKTFAAFGCYGAAAITSVTFQNTQGVFGAENQSAASVRNQVAPIFDDFAIDAVKTGMLPTREIIDEIAAMAIEFGFGKFVVDPVVRSTSGFDLIDDDALRSLIDGLFPLATIITPNAVEAERITGTKIRSLADIREAARVMHDQGARAVLIKGGHLGILDFGFGIWDLDDVRSNSGSGILELDSLVGRSDSGAGVPESAKPRAVDFLFIEGEEHRFAADFIETTATHGTGCTLSAAIAAGLAGGNSLIDAVDAAKRYVTAAIRTAPMIGKGHSPVNHLVSEP